MSSYEESCDVKAPLVLHFMQLEIGGIQITSLIIGALGRWIFACNFFNIYNKIIHRRSWNFSGLVAIMRESRGNIGNRWSIVHYVEISPNNRYVLIRYGFVSWLYYIFMNI